MLLNSKINEVLYYDLPKNCSFLIAHSLTPKPEIYSRSKREIKRECELKMCLAILIKKLNMKNDCEDFFSLQIKLNFSIEDMINLLLENFEKKSLKVEEIENICQTELINIIKEVPFADEVLNENHEYDVLRYLF